MSDTEQLIEFISVQDHMIRTCSFVLEDLLFCVALFFLTAVIL